MTNKNTSIALTCALALWIGSHAMAAAKAAASPAGQLKGTITAWDGAAKQVTIKSDDEAGKPWATLIRVDPAAAGSKAPADR